MRILIIGSGPAAVAAAISIRQNDLSSQIIIFSDENIIPYRRPLLVKMLTEKIPEERFLIYQKDFYQQNNIEIRLNSPVVLIDHMNHRIQLRDLSWESYDRLLIATGSRCREIFTGNAGQEFYTLHNYRDLLLLQQRLPECQNIFIIGGGVLGLEIAGQLLQKEYQVTVIERAPDLLLNALQKNGSHFLRNLLQKQNNLTVFTNCQVQSLSCLQNQRIRCLLHSNITSQLTADLVIAAIGNTVELPAFVPPLPDDGLSITPNMTAADYPDIFAAGDCVLSYSQPGFGSYATARRMGEIAGGNISGDIKSFTLPVRELRSQFMDIKIYSAGVISGKDITSSVKQTNDVWQELFYRNDLLVGCVLIGNIGNSGMLYEVITRNLQNS